MMRVFAVLTLLVLLSSCERTKPPAPTSTVASIPWLKQIEEAKARAAAEGKYLLIYFTCSDQHPGCQRFDKEVLGREELIDAVREKFVCLYLDDPKGDVARFAVADPQANAALRERYRVKLYPSIVLARSDLMLLGRVVEGGGELATVRERLANAVRHAETLKGYLETAPAELSTDALLAALETCERVELVRDEVGARFIALARERDAEPLREFLRAHEENEAIREVLIGAEDSNARFEQLLVVLMDSPHARGPTFVRAGTACAEWLLREQRWAEAKTLLERISHDPILREHEEQLARLRSFMKLCDDNSAVPTPK